MAKKGKGGKGRDKGTAKTETSAVQPSNGTSIPKTKKNLVDNIIDFEQFKKIREETQGELQEGEEPYVIEDEDGNSYIVFPIPTDIDPDNFSFFFVDDKTLDMADALGNLPESLFSDGTDEEGNPKFVSVDFETAFEDVLAEKEEVIKQMNIVLKINSELEKENIILKARLKKLMEKPKK
jgi:hypothetical protein